MAKNNALTPRAAMWKKSLQLVEVGNAFAFAAHVMKASAMFNIHAHKLYTEIGCENWNQFCEKQKGLTRGVADYYLKSGKKLDALLKDSDISYQGFIDESHIKMIREADLSVKEFREREIRLFDDGTVILKEQDFKQLPKPAEVLTAEQELRKALDYVITRWKAAKRGGKRTAVDAGQTKEALAADVRTGVAALAKAAFALRSDFAGYSNQEALELRYYLGLLDWYLSNPWVEDGKEWKFIDFENATSVKFGERPDVDFAMAEAA